jgi:hypothetical protein
MSAHLRLAFVGVATLVAGVTIGRWTAPSAGRSVPSSPTGAPEAASGRDPRMTSSSASLSSPQRVVPLRPVETGASPSTGNTTVFPGALTRAASGDCVGDLRAAHDLLA